METPEEAELRKLDTRVDGLKEVNRNLLNELSQAGANVDIGQARVEKFSEFLEEMGIIGRLERLKEQERWELHLRESLKPIVHKVREALVATGRDVQTQSGLILPGRNG